MVRYLHQGPLGFEIGKLPACPVPQITLPPPLPHRPPGPPLAPIPSTPAANFPNRCDLLGPFLESPPTGSRCTLCAVQTPCSPMAAAARSHATGPAVLCPCDSVESRELAPSTAWILHQYYGPQNLCLTQVMQRLNYCYEQLTAVKCLLPNLEVCFGKRLGSSGPRVSVLRVLTQKL